MKTRRKREKAGYKDVFVLWAGEGGTITGSKVDLKQQKRERYISSGHP